MNVYIDGRIIELHMGFYSEPCLMPPQHEKFTRPKLNTPDGSSRANQAPTKTDWEGWFIWFIKLE